MALHPPTMGRGGEDKARPPTAALPCLVEQRGAPGAQGRPQDCSEEKHVSAGRRDPQTLSESVQAATNGQAWAILVTDRAQQPQGPRPSPQAPLLHLILL